MHQIGKSGRRPLILASTLILAALLPCDLRAIGEDGGIHIPAYNALAKALNDGLDFAGLPSEKFALKAQGGAVKQPDPAALRGKILDLAKDCFVTGLEPLAPPPNDTDDAVKNDIMNYYPYMIPVSVEVNLFSLAKIGNGTDRFTKLPRRIHRRRSRIFKLVRRRPGPPGPPRRAGRGAQAAEASNSCSGGTARAARTGRAPYGWKRQARMRCRTGHTTTTPTPASVPFPQN